MTRFQTTLGELNYYEFMKIDYARSYEVCKEQWDNATIDIEFSNEFFNEHRKHYGTDNTIQTDTDSTNTRAREEGRGSGQTDYSTQVSDRTRQDGS